MTIEEYLKGKVGFDVNDNAIASILVDREVAAGTDVTELDKRTKDLCRADLYMWCASTPSKTGSVKDADGVWSHQEGGSESSAFDKRTLRQMANDIYGIYGENQVTTKIKITSGGMGLPYVLSSGAYKRFVDPKNLS